jgi:glycosyltransferase involved in cell wall biosynthesis
LRIGINTRLLLPGGLDGIGKFTSEVSYRLAALHPEHEFHWFFDRKLSLPTEPPSNVTTHVLPPPTRHPFLYYLWFEGMLPRALERNGIDRFFSPDGFLSLRSPVPSYPVIHDLNFEAYPEDLPFWTRHFYRRYFPKYARKAERVMTVSRYSAEDIASRYGIDPSSIRVVYNGVDESFHPLEKHEKEEVQRSWTDGTPYLIQVGTLHPRKNIVKTLQAFDALRKERDRDLKLVFAGKEMWWTPDMERAYRGMSYRKDVVFTGHVGDGDLAKLLASAEAMLYLSYFEGFGIPVLEAMKAGVPVLCADRTSLPEVGGDAALYTDPDSREAIVAGMRRLLDNEELRGAAIERGRSRAEAFTWDEVARKVAATLEEGSS